MSQKLWVEYQTPAKRFGPTKVSIEGCSDVDDFKEEIKKKFEVTGPASHLTLYKSDGTTEIDVGESPTDYLEGNSDENPLIVRSIPIEKEELAIGSPKRRKVDSLIEKSKQYLLRTDRWGCVTVIKKRRAVTFAHGEHQSLKPGMSIKIYHIEGNKEYDVEVIKTNAKSDWVLLESGVDLCERDPIWGPVADGHCYVQLGLFVPHQEESPLAISTGVVCSQRPTALGHTLGSCRANPGDSGGPCFEESTTSELIGINVGCENIPISMEKDTVAQINDKISSRYASRAHIIPVSSFQFVES